MRKPTIWFLIRSDTNQLYKYSRWLEAGNFEFKKQKNCSIPVAKTKVLISWVFVFAYAKCWFSLDMAQMFLILGGRLLQCDKVSRGATLTNTAQPPQINGKYIISSPEPKAHR